MNRNVEMVKIAAARIIIEEQKKNAAWPGLLSVGGDIASGLGNILMKILLGPDYGGTSMEDIFQFRRQFGRQLNEIREQLTPPRGQSAPPRGQRPAPSSRSGTGGSILRQYNPWG